MKKIIALLAVGFASLAHASDSPVGTWKTVDDSTGQPKSLVRIAERDGVLTGTVIKLFRAPDQDQNPKCDKCTDARKDQPILGMVILKNLKKDGDEYTGGEILDPANGKTYKSKLKVEEDGAKLNLRGYIGIPALGRTQVWERED